MLRIPALSRAALAALLLAGCHAATLDDATMMEPARTPKPAAAAVEAAPAAPAIPAAHGRPAPSAPGRARAGVVTAGDIDDTLNLAAFLRYQSRARKQVKLPMVNLSRPILAQLRRADGSGAAGVAFNLRTPGAAEPFYTGRSGVDGQIAVFPAALGKGRPPKVEMRVVDPEHQNVGSVMVSAGKHVSYTVGGRQEWRPGFLDLAFVVDTTGSMADELAWLTKDLKRLVRDAKRAAPGVDIRFGLVVYRDDGDAYVVKNYGFTRAQSQMQGWLRSQSAGGGGDYPEAAGRALASAAALNWRRGKGERLLIHVADAPARPSRAKGYLQAANVAAQKGIQIFGLGASGVGPEAEFLMRQAAVVTGGRYMFLTDDSGVGHGHAEPTVACYQVTALSKLVSRVLRSELTGIRAESAPADIIREVGSYNRGRCLG